MSEVSVGQADTVAEADCVVGDPLLELLGTPIGPVVVTAAEGNDELVTLGLPAGGIGEGLSRLELKIPRVPVDEKVD